MVILFNSEIGMNQNSNCLYKTLKAFCVKSSFDEEIQRFNTIKNKILDTIRKIPSKNIRINELQAIIENYGFDQLKQLLNTINRIVIDSNTIKNSHLEYDILNSLVITYNNNYINIIRHMSIYELRIFKVLFINILIYTLNGLYMNVNDLFFTMSTDKPSEYPIGVFIYIKGHVMCMYKCDTKYIFYDDDIVSHDDLNNIQKFVINYQRHNPTDTTSNFWIDTKGIIFNKVPNNHQYDFSKIEDAYIEAGGGYLYFKVPDEKYKIGYEPLFNRGILFPSTYIHKGSSYSRYVMDMRVCVAWKLKLLDE
jgi:hypothetical protein